MVWGAVAKTEAKARNKTLAVPGVENVGFLVDFGIFVGTFVGSWCLFWEVFHDCFTIFMRLVDDFSAF